MNLIGLLLTLIVGLFIFLGSVIGTYFKNNKKFTDFSISVAFGVIISLIVFEIMPEVFELGFSELGALRGSLAIVVTSLIGIVILKILDIFVPCHEHEEHHEHKHKSEKCHNEHLYHIGIVSSMAIILHNLIEGMSLYLVSSNSIISGLLLCVGIGLHNIPMGLIISSTLYNSNYSKKKTLNISLVVSFSTFIGGLIMIVLGGVNGIVETILLSLTLGMLIYISVFELLHQIYHMEDKKIVRLGIILGIILLIVSISLGSIVEIH